MDDLAGLDWTSNSTPQRQQNKPSGQGNYFPTLRPTPPISGRSTPSLASQPSVQVRSALNTSNSSSKPSTPAPDSFANLLPQFNTATNSKNLSLQEQQRRLQEQKLKQGPIQNKQWEADVSALESFGTGRSGAQSSGGRGTPAQGLPLRSKGLSEESEEDILAAFGKEAPVDRSSHFPVPTTVSRPGSAQPVASRQHTPIPVVEPMSFPDDDDDPFGLTQVPGKQSVPLKQQAPAPEPDDDDVLGLLGRPVDELPPRKPASPEPPALSPETTHPQEKAVAELVDMGFSKEKASEALAATASGLDVQAAVSFILNQAHAESRSKPQTPASGERQTSSTTGSRSRPPRTTSSVEDSSDPAWMRGQSRSGSQSRHHDNKNARHEGDPSKPASDLGSNFLKAANSLWKSGTKQFNKAVAEFNAEADSSQPKWMRDATVQEQPTTRPLRQTKDSRGIQQNGDSVKPKANDLLDMTEEAMMLESGGGRHPPKPKRPQGKDEARSPSSQPISRTQSPFTQPKFSQEPISRSKLRQALEEESAQAYVSPARRKRTTPKPTETEPEILFNDSSRPQAPLTTSADLPKPPSRPQTQARPKPSTPASIRPKAPPRNIPSISSIALQSSTQHRKAGNDAFKLGNYSSAGTSYTSSLQSLPSTHPLTIILLTNRALTYLKTGDPKSSIADADAAIALIGPSRGEGETIDTGTADEGTKPMQPFWGKAMMRRAEALEQLERWADAGAAWRTCVEAGVGGAQAIQARARCERAADPAPKPKPIPKAKTAPPRSRPAPPVKKKVSSALDDLGGGSGRPASAAPDGTDSEAVARMRRANAAAEKMDDEKFRLADSIDARLAAWRKGKEANLRALLGSLDAVLWEGSGWKKVGMGELILPAKVKIAYMKGIAKVHPDKLPQTASTEQVMISQAVFATLNEAWDKFKAENGL